MDKDGWKWGWQCWFCGREKFRELFFKCIGLNSHLKSHSTWFQGFKKEFSDNIFIGGLKYRFLLRRRMCLLKYNRDIKSGHMENKKEQV